MKNAEKDEEGGRMKEEQRSAFTKAGGGGIG